MCRDSGRVLTCVRVAHKANELGGVRMLAPEMDVDLELGSNDIGFRGIQ